MVAACQDYLFSVIVPVYNKEHYLREALESIIEQTIGFDRNIQILLINDGSTDSSAEICSEYADRYPGNISYYAQENKGVSAARNVGIAHASGKYITFFDADDVWDKDAFEQAFRLFEAHSEIDIAAAKLIQFGDVTSPHPLDYKFEKTCVVDLNIKPDFIQPMIGNCFFAAHSVLGRQFDTALHYAEDTLFVNDILLENPRMGILSDTSYHYRKNRLAGTASMRSTIARYASNNKVYLTLYSRSLKRFGFVHSFVKYTALYELGWQVFAQCQESFSPKEEREWHADIARLLDPVSDRDICTSPWLTTTKRLCLLQMKHGENYFSHVAWNDAREGYHNGVRLFSLNNFSSIVIDKLCVESNRLVIRGITKLTYVDPDATIQVNSPCGVKTLPLSPFPSCDAVLITGNTLFRARSFCVELPLAQLIGQRIFFTWVTKSGLTAKLPLQFTLYAKLASAKSYYAKDGVIVKKIGHTELKVMPDRLTTHLASEYRMCRSVIRVKGFTLRRRLGIIGVRIATLLYRAVKQKPIWIFIDREYKAGDNAEALFAYERNTPFRDQTDLCMLISKDSSDYARLKSIGTVLQPKSLRFYVKFLTSSKVLSGHHDAAVTNPFGKKGKYLADLFGYEFINLSHGTLQGDLSAQLNTHVRPIHRFIVSSRMERRALLSDKYGYSDDEVVLAGMCRYDMYDKARTKKLIVFLPTWRVSLAGKIIPGTREREYIPDFEKSEYCKTYNALINDERLLTAMKRAGYRGEFYVHPNYEKQASCFHGNEIISVSSSSADYVKVLSEGALMVSDYSGVTFDFAYMRKPVVYYQFDDLFNGAHSYKSRYFDYEMHGFGRVCAERDDLIAEIERILLNGCKMDEAYRSRADNFFEFSDRGNCHRVFDAIRG